MSMLYFSDTDTPCLGDVYDDTDTMGEKTQLSIQKHENDLTTCDALCNKVEAVSGSCGIVLDISKPIMTMLCFSDTNTPCLGDVYDDTDTMVKKTKLSIQKHENDSTTCDALCNKVEAIIHHCWEKMTTPLHLLAYALSPRYYSKEALAMPDGVAPHANEDVVNAFYKDFTRLPR